MQTWSRDWAWSLPLIVVNVLLHVSCLALITGTAEQVLIAGVGGHSPTIRLVVVMGSMTLLVTLLHGIGAVIWAVAYCVLEALPDYRSAMLYSLNAMTSYGHEPIQLKAEWQMMGALESLNGMLLLGFTTAFLFSMIQAVLPLAR